MTFDLYTHWLLLYIKNVVAQAESTLMSVLCAALQRTWRPCLGGSDLRSVLREVCLHPPCDPPADSSPDKCSSCCFFKVAAIKMKWNRKMYKYSIWFQCSVNQTSHIMRFVSLCILLYLHCVLTPWQPNTERVGFLEFSHIIFRCAETRYLPDTCQLWLCWAGSVQTRILNVRAGQQTERPGAPPECFHRGGH